MGVQKGQTEVKAPPADGTAGFGWVYDAAQGTIVVNTGNSETGRDGQRFNTF